MPDASLRTQEGAFHPDLGLLQHREDAEDPMRCSSALGGILRWLIHLLHFFCGAVGVSLMKSALGENRPCWYSHLSQMDNTLSRGSASRGQGGGGFLCGRHGVTTEGAKANRYNIVAVEVIYPSGVLTHSLLSRLRLIWLAACCSVTGSPRCWVAAAPAWHNVSNEKAFWCGC